MHSEPKQKKYALRDPSIKRSLEIAKKYRYTVSVMHLFGAKAFLSVYAPFLKSPYPQHFTSVIRTAAYVEAAFEKYNS